MKKTISVFLVFLLLCTLAVPTFAAEGAETLRYVTDDAGVFSAEELALFEETAKGLSEAYACGVYFVTLEDYTQISDGEPYDAAEQIYDEWQMGYAGSGDGVLLMVSTDGGNCALVSQGTAVDAIDDLQSLLDECVDAYGDNGYADITNAYYARVNAIFAENLPAISPPEVPTAPAASQFPAPELDGYVTDLPGILSADDEAALESKAADLSGQYGCGVYIIIVDDYKKYGSGSAYTVAGDVFLACNLGEGPQKAGVLLLMSMKERDVTILTNEAGHAMVGPDAKDWLASKYLKHFKKNAWAQGYDAYLTNLAAVLEMAAKGKPMTMTTFPESIAFGWLLSILGGFGIAYLLLAGKRNKMVSVFAASSAAEYIAQGGIQISKRSDTFVNKTTTRRKIETNSSSGGSSGSRSSDSRGFSGRSDKF